MSELTETNYEHIKGGETFTVTAAEQWSIAMVRRLKEKYPDQVEIAYVNKDGSLLARMPFDWMRIVPKRRDTLTDERRAELSERMRTKNPRAGIVGNISNSHTSPQKVFQHIPGTQGAEMEAIP